MWFSVVTGSYNKGITMLDIPTSIKPLTNAEYVSNINELREMHVIGVHDFGTFMANFGVNSLQRRSFVLAFYRFIGLIHSADGSEHEVNTKGNLVASMVAQGDFLDYEVQLLLSEDHESKSVLINVVHIKEDDTTALVISLKADVRQNSQGAMTMWCDGGASLVLKKAM